MREIKRADDFLRFHGMHPDCVDFEACKQAFIADMRAGLSGSKSSLLMIPAYLKAEGQANEGETAIAIDIGGSNLRIALTQYRNGIIHVLSSNEWPVPGRHSEITKDAFFNEIADRLWPVLHQSSRIGVCFSHAAEILPNRDGRLLSFSKEIRVSGSEGMEIIRELSNTLRDRGCHEKKSYVLLNDTTAVLLGGAAVSGGNRYDGYIGFVLGTGKNLCYTEKTSEIKKLAPGSYGDTMIINTESGYFTRVPGGTFDRELDSTTVNPGTHLLEKMTSGRYLGQLILLAFKRAASDGLLSKDTSAAVQALGELPLPDISGFLTGKGTKNVLSEICKTENDRQIFLRLADQLVERSAKLAVMSVAAVMEKTDTGHQPDRPVCIVADGSTFYKLQTFKEKFSDYVHRYINTEQTSFCHIEKVINATLLGSAFAALIN